MPIRIRQNNTPPSSPMLSNISSDMSDISSDMSDISSDMSDTSRSSNGLCDSFSYENPSNITESSYDHFIPSPPRLVRRINSFKWSEGQKVFDKLYQKYKIMCFIIYILPILIISNNVFVIQYFTGHQFFWHWGVMPISIFLILYYFLQDIMFATKPCISDNKFSKFPGPSYEYGCLIYICYDREDNEFHPYEYWVVFNPITNCSEQIIIENENYNMPIHN